MRSIQNGKTVHIVADDDVVLGLIGVSEGYRLTLHDLPEIEFRVDAKVASSGDAAQRAVLAYTRHAGIAPKTGCTFQRL